MSKKKDYRAKDKIVQKMSKEGLQEINLRDKTTKNISEKIQDVNLSKNNPKDTTVPLNDVKKTTLNNRTKKRLQKEIQERGLNSPQTTEPTYESMNGDVPKESTFSKEKVSEPLEFERIRSPNQEVSFKDHGGNKESFEMKYEARHNQEERMIRKDGIESGRQNLKKIGEKQQSYQERSGNVLDTKKNNANRHHESDSIQRKEQLRRQQRRFQEAEKTELDYDRDNDGVIDRYDADFRDSTVSTFGDLDKRESNYGVENERQSMKRHLSEQQNFKDISSPNENVKTSKENSWSPSKSVASQSVGNEKEQKKARSRKQQKKFQQEVQKTELDYDRDNDGVIDRYDADFRDSKVMTYGDLDEREDERVETEFHEYKPIPKDSINFKSSSEQKVNVKETLSKASFLTKDPKEIVDKSSERLKKQKRKQVQTFQKGDKKDRLIMEEMKATDDEKSLNLKEVLKNDVDLKELKEKRQEPEVDFSLEGRDKKTDNQMSRGKKGNLKDSIQTLKEKKNLKKDPLAEKGEPHEGESGSDVKKRSKTKKDAKQKETEKQQSSETDKKEEKEKSESKKQKKQSKLLFEEEEKESKYHGTKEGALLKKAVISGAVMASALAKKSIHTEDDDNSGLEALRGAKTTSIKARRGMKRLQMKREGRRVKKVSKRREKFRKNSMSEPNATMGKKAKKEFQKKKQQRNYAKTIRKKQKKVFGGLKEKIGALWHSIRNSSKRSIAPIVIILLLLLGLMVGMQSCSAIMLGGLGAITGSSYQADDLEITGADLEYTRLEANLLKTIEDMEKDHPGYDEYRYNLSSVGHDPHELIAYLTALFQDFRLEEVRSEIEAVFQAQYTLTTQEIIERYTTTHRYKDPHTGQIYTVEQEHEKKILEITLNSKPLDSVLKSRMDEDQKEIYDVLMETKGNFMTFPSPIEGEWKTAITSMFGYRVHPIDKTVKLHTGIDIGGAEGTALKAVFDGVVVEKAFDSSGYGHYVVIEDKNGGQALYAHCSSVDVSIGEEVKTEQVIAKMGSTGKSTGSHLHFELKDKDGNHLNPYFYLHSKVDKLPSSASTYYNGYTGEYGNPGIAFDDETVRRLFAEAEKHIGKAYVYGAVGPNNFDCSSFVCWSFRVSGVRPDMYRTTAQEIFNKCTPITREEAKAGDLVFFTGTYDAKRPVSHVGLYAGEGMMLHAGDPIQYASIDTNYWRNHFYAFGRLR